MQGMIMHHAQAVVMAQLVPSRTTRDDLKTLAKRIDVSQRDEIRMMQQWLKDRHLEVPMAPLDTMSIGMDHAKMHAQMMKDTGMMRRMAMDSGMKGMGGMKGMDMMMDSSGHMMLMPGMLSDEQMRLLAAAKGAAFDSLFLNGMIRHHQGALQMVAELREKPGAMQDPATFEFASDVDAVQRAEIRAMSAMLRK